MAEPVPLNSQLYVRLFRANRSRWQDVFCEGLVRTPSAKLAAAATATA